MGAIALNNSGEMNVEEAAQYCLGRGWNITSKTIRNKLAKHEGPRHIKRFGRIFFLAADLDAWIAANTEVRKAFGRR